MATKNIVPRSDKEGQLGTNAKQWNKVIAHTGSFQAVSSSLIPDSADTYDLGSSTKFWKDLYISSGSIKFIDPSDNSIASTISVSSDGTLNIGSAVVSGSSIPDADNTYDLGSSSKQWKDLYINGTANIDRLALDGGSEVTIINDEDDMSSDSATALATQQSIKAYVDSQVTAQDLDATTDSGTIDIDLDSETLTIAGGEGIDTSATGTTITIAGEEASTSNKGVASFSSDNFAVSSGVVTIKDSGVANDELAGSIANAKLANSSITLTQGAGMGSLGAVSLGGSVTVGVDGVLEDLDTLGAASSDGEIIVATGAGAFAYESGATLRTSIGVDAAGTDNSTDVTLVTTSHDYLSLSGQAITLGTIDIGDDTNLVGGTGITLTGDTLSTTDSEIVHDSLSGFVANEHIDHSSVSITAGDGLTGGGDLTSTRTLAVQVDDSSIEINSDTLRVKASGITNAMLGGSITNAKLANSTISGVSLGSNLNDLTVDDTTIQLNSGTTYNGSAARTISGKTAAIANGGSALATADQIHTFVTTQTDSTAADTSGNAATATLASTVTVSDSTANTNFPVAFHNESNALLDDTGTFTYNPSTSTLVVPNINVSGTQTFVDTANLVVTSSIIFEGATADGYETTLTVVDPTADRTITLPNATDTVALLAATQTFTNKTLTSPDVNTPDIDGGTIDGATIATSNITVGSGKTLNVSGGTLTTSTAQKVAIIGGGDTDDLSEGSSNLYYTDARVVTKIDSLAVVSGSAPAISTTNMTDASNKRFMTDAQETKLDSVESNATADQTDEEIQDIVGAMLTGNTETGITVTYQDGDGTIDFAVASQTDENFTTADHSKLDGIEASADVTDTDNVTAAGALMDSEVTDLDGIKSLTVPNDTTISTFGASLVDDADAAAARTTLGVDAAGTDNSTDVTLAGSLDYLTLSGQQITRNAIDLTTDVTGVLPSANLDSDTAHLSGTQTFSGDKTFSGGVHISTSSDPKLQFTSAEAGTDNYEIYVGGSGLKFRNTSDAATPLELNEDGSVIITGLGGSDGATGFPSLRLSNSVASGDWDTGDVVGNLEFYVEDTSGNAPYVVSFIKSVNPQNNGTLPGGYLSFGTSPYNQSGGATEEFRMETDGDFHAVGDVVAYSSTPSDERLKDNVVTIDSGLSLVNQLRGVTFDWNQGSKQGKKDYGVIAQEVEKVIPEVVSEKKLPLIADNDEVYKTVDYEKLTAVLIEAVKDLSKEIDDIKQKCDCLNK